MYTLIVEIKGIFWGIYSITVQKALYSDPKIKGLLFIKQPFL